MIPTVDRKSHGDAASGDGILASRQEPVDREAILTAALRYEGDDRRRSPVRQVSAERSCDTLIRQIMDAVDTRLPGRIRDLAIRSEQDDRYVLSGVTTSYYVKQLAQHLAMGLIAHGRLINDIEVRTAR
ncbi:MAG: hypothetical protein AAF961_04470 [Planctomycetota bacterium]